MSVTRCGQLGNSASALGAGSTAVMDEIGASEHCITAGDGRSARNTLGASMRISLHHAFSMISQRRILSLSLSLLVASAVVGINLPILISFRTSPAGRWQQSMVAPPREGWSNVTASTYGLLTSEHCWRKRAAWPYRTWNLTDYVHS